MFYMCIVKSYCELGENISTYKADKVFLSQLLKICEQSHKKQLKK